MSNLMHGAAIHLAVDAGSSARVDSIVVAELGQKLPVSASDLIRLREIVDREDVVSQPIPAQLDASGRLTFVLAGETPAGSQRRFIVDVSHDSVSSVDAVAVEKYPAILVIGRGDRTVAHYNYASVWKPYLCPLNGPVGNVVRGASAEHQHQAGLFFSYGGHFTPTNIWSDWDEPIYGPDGKMLHRRFEWIQGGPVFAEIAERIGYMAAEGSILLEELRLIRLYPLADGTSIVDFIRTCPRPTEPSDGPFSLSVRVADPLRTVDNARRGPPPERKMVPVENPGQMENSSGEVTRGESLQSERWLDRSGLLPGGWGGLAFLDYPGNPGYPGKLNAAGYGTMMLSYRFPEDATVATWRYRVVAHRGDATDARVEHRWQDYANPMVASLD